MANTGEGADGVSPDDAGSSHKRNAWSRRLDPHPSEVRGAVDGAEIATLVVVMTGSALVGRRVV